MAAALTPRVKVPGEKTPLHKVVSECFKGWLDDRSAREQPVAGYGEQEFRGYLTCGLLCFRFTRAGCTRCTQTFVVAFSCKARGVCPSCNGRHMARDGRASCRSRHPAGARAAVVISVPKRLRGMLADRPQAVAALTRIFLTEIARLLYALAGLPPDADTPRAARPRLGGISSLHRFGSALNHHVHRHACVTDGVFMPPIDGAGSDTAPVFRPARPITQLHLAALTERVRRRVIRWFRRSRLLDAAGESPRGRERAVSSSSRRLSSSIA